jgi:glucose/mannose-6-phosphate isomerase
VLDFGPAYMLCAIRTTDAEGLKAMCEKEPVRGALVRKNILDNRAVAAKIDRENMLGVLEETPDAYELAYEAASASGSLPEALPKPPPYLALVGMGGSAIGADILKEWLSETGTAIEVIRGPRLPGSIHADTCVLVVSYSGQTAETLRALREAQKRNAKIACIASGGALLRICRKEGIPHIQVQAGLQPREALPDLLCASFVTLERWAVCKHQTIQAELKVTREQLVSLRKKIGFERSQARNSAKKLALRLDGTIPFIYTSQYMAAAGRRFKNQLNENAKVMAKFDALPEMMHNEVQGWHMLKEGFSDSVSFVLLRACEDEEEAKQLERLRHTIRQLGGRRIHQISLESATPLSAILTMIYYCDYVSFYLAIARGVNPTPIATIQSLKRLTRPST